MSISRIDHPARNTYGYYIRVQRSGVLRSRFISDSVAGGKRKALRRAMEIEAELIEYLESTVKPLPPKLSARNRSGVTGVSRTWMSGGGNRMVEYWQANWKDAEGVRRGAKFSIDRYGEEKAFRLAKKARRDGMAYQNQ
jgi:hypothetical protein